MGVKPSGKIKANNFKLLHEYFAEEISIAARADTTKVNDNFVGHHFFVGKRNFVVGARRAVPLRIGGETP